MKKVFGPAIMLMLALVLVAGGLVTGCGGTPPAAALVAPDVTLYQYLKGTTGDIAAVATLNSIAESGGESGWKYGLAMSIYPSYFTTAKLDAQANISFPAPYKIIRNPSVYPLDATLTTYTQLQAGDQSTVKGALFAKMTAAEQDCVVNAVAGFFNRQDTDMSNATAASASTPYLTLKGISQTVAYDWLQYANGSVAYPAGQDWVDRFYIDMVKASFPAGTLDATLLSYGIGGFSSATAGAMNPLVQYNKALAMYSTKVTTVALSNFTTANVASALSLLNATEKAYVNGAVYANLTSYYADDVARLAARDAKALGLYTYGLVSANTYWACKGLERNLIDQAIGSTGKWERDYIDFAAVPGAIAGWNAQMFPVKDLTKSMCYVTLNSAIGLSAAKGWLAAVQASVHPRQAFYRWMAYEAVSASGAMGTLCQMMVGEFSFKVVNTNLYDITLDSLNINYATNISATPALGVLTARSVDAAKLAIGDKIWVPAATKADDGTITDGQIIFKTMVPIKTYDMITWLAMSGGPTGAGMVAWTLIQSGGTTGQKLFTVTADASISSETETIAKTYTMYWTV
ncbi:MAG: hypothetical protein NTU41_13220 [Chloroflexi bacterium]|nr:hypothetical protein [Chloroflexota bacterium]